MNEQAETAGPGAVLIEKHGAAVEVFTRNAETLEVKNDFDLQAAAAVVKAVRDMAAHLETERKALVKPFNEGVKNINSRAKAITEPLTKARQVIEGKMLAYQNEKREAEERRQRAEEEKRRKEEEERKLAEAEAAEAAGDKEAAEEILEDAVKPPPPPPVRAPVRETVRGAAGPTVGVRHTWTFQVVNPELVPQEFLVVNEALIRKAIRGGAREIKGIRIYQERATVVR